MNIGPFEELPHGHRSPFGEPGHTPQMSTCVMPSRSQEQRPTVMRSSQEQRSPFGSGYTPQISPAVMPPRVSQEQRKIDMLEKELKDLRDEFQQFKSDHQKIIQQFKYDQMVLQKDIAKIQNKLERSQYY